MKRGGMRRDGMKDADFLDMIIAAPPWAKKDGP
jgi:hypothetical protein